MYIYVDNLQWGPRVLLVSPIYPECPLGLQFCEAPWIVLESIGFKLGIGIGLIKLKN